VSVVEDEPDAAGLVQRALERDGYAVDIGTNGDEALWAEASQPYDAVVLHAMIPPPVGSKCAGGCARRVLGCL
jgi:two-component system OmpR family response regulator